MSNPCQVDVVVIGAGWAGLSTAAGLAARGRGKTDNVVVLEADERIGGRCFTLADQFQEGHPLEAGASWTYPGTSLARLAKQYGVNTVRSIFRDFQTLGLYNSSGAVVNPLLEELLNDNYKRTFVKFAAGMAGDNISIQDILDAYFESPECDAVGEDCSVISEPHRQVINAMAERIMGAEYAAPLNNLESEGPVFLLGRGSGIGAPSTRVNNVDYTAIPGGGYKSIIDGFVAENSLIDKIKLDRTVTTIDQSNGDKVVVTAKTSEGAFEYYSAAAVVVTVSLGILKAKDINFVPALSSDKQNAIDNLGMGTLNKVFLYWENEPAVWPGKEMVDLVLITPNDETSGVLTYCFNEQSQPGNENYFTFLCWTSGDVANELEESKSDEELKNMALANLRTMLGNDLPDPHDYYVTRWKSNEFTKGSYSYPPVGVNDVPALREELARPEDRVFFFFAGEATMVEDYGTAYGAYESGAEVAFELRRSGLY
jgi:polyamine oxidase